MAQRKHSGGGGKKRHWGGVDACNFQWDREDPTAPLKFEQRSQGGKRASLVNEIVPGRGNGSCAVKACSVKQGQATGD